MPDPHIFADLEYCHFDQFLEEMDPDPDPYIWIQLDPDLDPQKKYGSATLFLTHKYITFWKGHEFKLVGN